MRIRMIAMCLGILLLAGGAAGQSNVDLARLTTIPAVPGHEQALNKAIAELLKDFHPETDNDGNVWVTIGNGAPHRLIATAIDEAGYVVSEITPDGYLRVQRLPQAPPNPVFDALNFAQPVVVTTRSGKQLPGVFAGLSVHLQPGRPNASKMNHVEELYVDIGAKSAEEVRTAGVDVLDPVAANEVAIERLPWSAVEWKSLGNGGRFGLETLLHLPARVKANVGNLTGSATIAFVTGQTTGGRGLDRLLNEIHPDEMVLVGRITAKAGDSKAELIPQQLGSGVLIGAPEESAENGKKLVRELQSVAEKARVPVTVVTTNRPRIAGFGKSSAVPEAFVQLGVPTLWPGTPAESVSGEDVTKTEELIAQHLVPGESDVALEHFSRASSNTKAPVIGRLTEVYGASGHEGEVRELVKRMLPEWAKSKATTDAAGNLVLHLGDGKKDEKTPRIAFVAHMDEIGYEVKKIEDDGRLQVEVLGGGYPQYFLGHVALVHTKNGRPIGAVMELPAGWDKPGFEFSTSLRSMDEPAHVYVGTKTKEETEKLGIAVGDYVTIPKRYVPLLGTRANARSFDDRVGCMALINAVNALGGLELPGRDVTFVWSTEEEVGLKGAAAFAEQAAKEGRTPDFVFAIDTFVSSDSPLESKRFADAELGKGFVVRAVDNSNIVPLEYVDKVVKLAKENGIPAQYGVTGGGNDGSVFTRYGSVDVALGWPLRYSHSPAEVIDTKDLDALSRIVEVIARKW